MKLHNQVSNCSDRVTPLLDQLKAMNTVVGNALVANPFDRCKSNGICFDFDLSPFLLRSIVKEMKCVDPKKIIPK